MGQKDFDDVFVTTVDVEVVAAAAAAAVAAADNSSDMVASKFDHLWRWGRRKLMRFRIEILIVRMKFNRAYIGVSLKQTQHQRSGYIYLHGVVARNQV